MRGAGVDGTNGRRGEFRDGLHPCRSRGESGSVPILDLVHKIHRSSVGTACWSDTLTQLASATAADAAVLVVRQGRNVDSWTTGERLELQRSCLGRASSSLSGSNFPTGVGPPLEEDGHYQLVTVVLRDRGIGASLVVGREGGRGVPFDGAESATLRLLLPHLESAVQVYHRLSGLESRARAFDDLCDRLDFGVVLLESPTEVLLINSAGRGILNSGDGLSLTPRGLIAADAAENAALARVVGQAARAARGMANGGGERLEIRRPSGSAPLKLFVFPLGSQSTLSTQPTAKVAILVNDPEQSGVRLRHALRRKFALTVAEASLAILITKGRTLEEASHDLEIRRSTARTHLKAVFQKIGVGRQAELVRVLLNSTTLVREP